MSKTDDVSEEQNVRYEIAQKEDLEYCRTFRGIEIKQFTQTNVEFKSTRSEPVGVCWKIEMLKTGLRFYGMMMTSLTDIFDVITSQQRLWSLLPSLVTNIDVNIILDLSEHRSLNIN